jgi:uncharacterized coiled-coil DUF342 family protein
VVAGSVLRDLPGILNERRSLTERIDDFRKMVDALRPDRKEVESQLRALLAALANLKKLEPGRQRDLSIKEVSLNIAGLEEKLDDIVARMGRATGIADGTAKNLAKFDEIYADTIKRLQHEDQLLENALGIERVGNSLL